MKVNTKHYTKAIKKVITIKEDFQRECKSWYKFDQLHQQLFDLKDEYEALAKELSRSHLINLKYQGQCKCKIDFEDLNG